MSHERTAKQLMDALPSGKWPRGRHRTRWLNYVEDLAWSRLRISPAKLPLIAGDRDAWRSQFEPLSPQPQKGQAGKRELQWTNLLSYLKIMIMISKKKVFWQTRLFLLVRHVQQDFFLSSLARLFFIFTSINAHCRFSPKKFAENTVFSKISGQLQCFVTQSWPKFLPKPGNGLNVTSVCRLIDYIK